MPRLRFQVLYFLSWISFFFLCRLVFLLYFFGQAKLLGFGSALSTFQYGIRLDASFAAYLSAVPFLVCIAAWLLKSVFWQNAVKVYTGVLVVLFALLHVVDLGLYAAWGFRLDATPLQYLNTPDEMLASAGAAPNSRWSWSARRR